MKDRRITPARVSELKAEAKQMKQELGLKQATVLAHIAKREGFRSWEELVGLAGGSEAVREVRFELPTEANIARGERHAERLRRYGGGR